MIVIVEHSISLIDSKGIFIGSERYSNYLFEFNRLLTLICNSKNEEELRRNFRLEPNSDYFLFGFGSNHMWMKQIIDGEPRQQVLFVDLR